MYKTSTLHRREWLASQQNCLPLGKALPFLIEYEARSDPEPVWKF